MAVGAGGSKKVQAANSQRITAAAPGPNTSGLDPSASTDPLSRARRKAENVPTQSCETVR
jgi:hypothetical protein